MGKLLSSKTFLLILEEQGVNAATRLARSQPPRQEPQRSAQLARAMQRLVSEHTKQTNTMMGWEGAIFRGCFRHRIIDADAYRKHLLACLHLNPRRAGQRVMDGPPWTSHAINIGAVVALHALPTAEFKGLHSSPVAYLGYVESAAQLRSRKPSAPGATKIYAAKTRLRCARKKNVVTCPPARGTTLAAGAASAPARREFDLGQATEQT